jgi:ribosomal protein S27AE
MPPLFDRLSKGVSKAADQAKFEAEKLRKTTALNSEISKLKQQIVDAKAGLGEKVIELQDAGASFPGLDELIQGLHELKAQLAAKEDDLATVKALDYVEADQSQEAGAAKFCPNCGAKLADGAKFCPECGTKTA